MPEKLGPVKFLSLHTYKNMVCKYFWGVFNLFSEILKSEEIDDLGVESLTSRYSEVGIYKRKQESK